MKGKSAVLAIFPGHPAEGGSMIIKESDLQADAWMS
jgi:hypothetical protein